MRVPAAPGRWSSNSAAAASASPLFLGLDCSTQGLKAVAVTDDLTVEHACGINFDEALPAFGTRGGVLASGDGSGVVRQPVCMFAAGLELLLDRMQEEGFDFSRVAAVSGSGQQHGSVYLSSDAAGVLGGEVASGTAPLAEAVEAALAEPLCPVWMDSSTGRECGAMTRAMGAEALARVTGSRAYERFTGPQIARMARTRAGAVPGWGGVSLISSFLASLVLGGRAPADLSDASGMNLLGLGSRGWDDGCLHACAAASEGALSAERLRELLGDPVPSWSCLGTVSSRLRRRYGLPSGCAAVAWSGDNPCSLAGLRLERPGDVAVSLGTSDTVIGTMEDASGSADGSGSASDGGSAGADGSAGPPALDGHVFASPTVPGGFMALLCFKNGSLARERVRDAAFAAAGGSADATAEDRWAFFEEALLSGSEDEVGALLARAIDQPEITPDLPAGDVLLSAGGEALLLAGSDLSAWMTSADRAAAVLRAAVECQVMSMRLAAEARGLRPEGALLVTGGGSRSGALLQLLADVFDVPVMVGETPDSAALGAAFRAKHAVMCGAAGGHVPFGDIGPRPAHRTAARPRPGHAKAFAARLPALQACHDRIRAGTAHAGAAGTV